ncbi:MAG: hypothetical protein WC982_01595 [Advenella sp.]
MAYQESTLNAGSVSETEGTFGSTGLRSLVETASALSLPFVVHRRKIRSMTMSTDWIHFNVDKDILPISIQLYGGNIGKIQRHVFYPGTSEKKWFVSGYSSNVDANHRLD